MAARVWKTTPMSPRVTDQACPTATAATAVTGLTPRPTSMGATTAIGSPKPARPSNVPLKAQARMTSSKPCSPTACCSPPAMALIPPIWSTTLYKSKAGQRIKAQKARAAALLPGRPRKPADLDQKRSVRPAVRLPNLMGQPAARPNAEES